MNARIRKLSIFFQLSLRTNISTQYNSAVLAFNFHCIDHCGVRQTDCEKLAPISAYEDVHALPVAADHFSAAGPLTLNSNVTASSDHVEPVDQQMCKSKSDSALSSRDKSSSLSSEEGPELDRVTSKSSMQLSQDHADEDSVSSNYRSQLSYTMSPTITSNSVPYTSYSSSDDDDDAEFFDADEFHDFERPILKLSR